MSTMESHCKFFVLRKKRYCRMTVRPGALYCGEHQPKNDAEDDNVQGNDLKRIACPLDPKHTCFSSKLEKHLKICNARQKATPEFIKKDYNIPDVNDVEEIEQKRSLSVIPLEKIQDVINAIESIYQSVIEGNITKFEEQESHPSVDVELRNEKRGNNTLRHLQQTSSLLNIVKSEKLHSKDTCFVEFGAGKGHMSYYLASGLDVSDNSSVILVDRASHRHKQDNKLDKEVKDVVRIRADISDLVLNEIPQIKNSNNVVGISKHLCGVATDLALQCVTKAEVVQKITGIIMAVCCHHRCQWRPYVGKSFLEERNIGRFEFDIICGIVSWATCGSGFSRSKRSEIQNESGTESKRIKLDMSSNVEIDKGEHSNRVSSDTKEETDGSNIKQNTNETISKRLGLSLERRAEVGFKAKAVLDWGRNLFLREHGFKSNLCYYVDKEVSLENVCIVATNNE